MKGLSIAVESGKAGVAGDRQAEKVREKKTHVLIYSGPSKENVSKKG